MGDQRKSGEETMGLEQDLLAGCSHDWSEKARRWIDRANRQDDLRGSTKLALD
jgi:hypothetical protein